MIAFLAPTFLALGLLSLPILALYLLRLRRQEMIVSSTLLWEELFQDREANSPWQRLRRNILLILQLAILIGLVFAVARPYLPVSTFTTGNTVIVIDGSASMLSADVLPNRITKAKEEAQEIINNLGNDDQVTVIVASDEARILATATSDKDLLKGAIFQAEAKAVEPDWESAMALAAGATQGYENGRVVIISDGGFPNDIPEVPGEIYYSKVGTRGENLAILGLETRKFSGSTILFANIRNYGNLKQTALLSIYVDEQLQDSQNLELEAGSSENFTWELDTDVEIIEATLVSQGEDYLSEDNRAWTINWSNPQRRVLLLTEGNRFLETVFTTLPGVDLIRATGEESIIVEEYGSFDLIVVDGVPLPVPIPTVPILYIDPQENLSQPENAEEPMYQIGETFAPKAIVKTAESPLLVDVSWDNVNILQASRITAPWSQPIVESAEGPILLAGDYRGQRVVLIPFALQESDLPLQIAFPLLVANITDWLAPGQKVQSFGKQVLGSPVQISTHRGEEAVQVIKPDGTSWRSPTLGRGVVYSEIDQLGVYDVVHFSNNGDTSVSHFAVNLTSPGESNIVPSDSIILGNTVVNRPETSEIGQNEIWRLFAIIVILILILEWWIFHVGKRFHGIRLIKHWLGQRLA
jgi:hypothetical protein